ncbi:MAG: hypothetical protein OER88_01080 [Planctomycetota bacterium]|nr:hypothetical protein [Planctomycetota bacterium]
MRYPLSPGLLYPAALVSGATALIYEIVWARHLSLLLGSTTAAAAAVLSSFMLGLALGAVLVGSRADDSRRPARWYGVLELGIGIYALAFDSLLGLAGGLFGGQPWLTAFALLLVPSALMGATLPVLARAGADSLEKGTRVFGGLYGINTLGAVLGALFATLVFMPGLGLTGAVRVAAGLNILVGVGFWIVGQAAGERPVYQDDSETKGGRLIGDAEFTVLFAFFLAGFAGLALEMAWFRLLVHYLEGFTIAFGLMLAAYLTGLGFGSLAGTPFAISSQNPRRLLGRVLLVQAVLAVLTFLFATPLGDGLESMRSGYAEAAGMDFGYGFRMFLTALAIVLPATFCAGALTPVVARITISDRESIGRHTGAVYAATTFGAVLAPPVAAFVLIPTFGVPGTIAAMGALVLVAGSMLALGRGVREWAFAGAAAVVFVAVCLVADLSAPLVTRSHVFRADNAPARRLLAIKEGTLGSVAVVEELRDSSRRLYIDGFSAAETSPQYGYMRLQGHLPMLLHPAPKRACVIAFGTGTTAGAVVVHAGIEVDCVEVEPAVYDVAEHFAAANRGVLENPRVKRIVDDGRAHLARTDAEYDVITLEPLMPYTPAAVYLYTQEFYETAQRRLTSNGVLCQWIPPQGVSADDTRRLIASMTAVFDHVSVWYFKHAMLVLGSASAPTVDGAVLLQRCTPEVLGDLRNAFVGSPAHLLGAHVCSGAELVSALDGAAPFRDDHTELEFRPIPRRMGKLSLTYFAENLEWLAKVQQTRVAWIEKALPGTDVALESRAAVVRTLAVEMRRRVEGGTVVPSAVLAPVLARDKTALFAQAVHDRRAYGERMARGEFEVAAQLAFAPDRSVAFLKLADDPDVEAAARVRYLKLALRENHILGGDAALLRELAEALDGAEKRFCLNRARMLDGQEPESGEETLPDVAVPNLAAALEAGDEDQARSILEIARQACVLDEVEDQAWDWFLASEDPRGALGMLHRIDSTKVARAAFKVAKSRQVDDLVAVAPIFCRRYPKRWEQLCTNSDVRVREAAADAAKGEGGPQHLPMLAKLCGDEAEQVRLSAIIALREHIENADQRTGYNYKDPTPEALKKLAALAES